MKANMKKLLAMGLALTLTVGSLTGCGDTTGGKDEDPGKGTNEQQNQQQNEEGGESTGKKTFDDLGGMSIVIGDWYTSDEIGES